MTVRKTVSLAFAAACLTAIATMPAHTQMAGTYGSPSGYSEPQSVAPQTNQSGVTQSASARRNVVQSQHYDRTLEKNRGFRQARMRKECGPITDPELRQSCLASFNQDEPQMGSSSPRRGHRSEAGR
jgi:hypothetical protein